MSGVEVAYRAVTTPQPASVVQSALVTAAEALGGRVAVSESNRLDFDLGSLAKSRLIGEFWVSGSTLPKRVTARWETVDAGGTRLEVWVADTHQLGVKWGYVGKYEQALREVADRIVVAVPDAVEAAPSASASAPG
jgi:hypothetical protein